MVSTWSAHGQYTPARLLRLLRAPWQHPSSAAAPPQGPLAAPQLGSCASSGPLGSAPARLLRLLRAPWQRPSSAPVPPQGAPDGSGAARYAQSEAQPPGTQPPP